MRVGIYGWGLVAPKARNVEALEALLRTGATALAPIDRPGLGKNLFPVGDPDFSFDDYAPWIAQRHGEAYVGRLRKKMGDNVRFAVGATIQALRSNEKLETLARELDEQCHVYIGSGVGDLPQSYGAGHSLEKASRAWNHFWAQPSHCEARRDYEASGVVPEAAGPPPADPSKLPVDSDERFEALVLWDAFWSAQSLSLVEFLRRFAEVEEQGALDEEGDKAHLDAIRRRVRSHRALLEEVGCPPPPWTTISPNLIWNIQNAPAAQITMLLGVHGAAWAPVGACSTFGVALKTGRDAILRGEAKLAIVGTTDPRPDAALIGAFHQARVMSGTGEVNAPFTSLRGTHISGGACIWILGDEEWGKAQGLEPVGGYLESVTISSDAEHIITPSRSGPKRAIVRAFAEAGIKPGDVAIADLHATGTPGDLNELDLLAEFLGEKTRITARKGQLGHGMANSGGWELTALALGLRDGEALPTGIAPRSLHPRIARPDAIVSEAARLETSPSGAVGVKLMLGIGGITACVVLRGSRR